MPSEPADFVPEDVPGAQPAQSGPMASHPGSPSSGRASWRSSSEAAPLILILTPILLPVVQALGMDPVHFGMMMMVNLGMGLITPPVGSVLFVGSAIAKLPLETVTKALFPFFLALLLVLLLITFVPGLSLWFPSLFGF